MKTRILTTMALVGFTMASAAFAATTAVDTIKAIVPDESVTMSDGTTYTLADGVKVGEFKVGDKVSITWEMDGTAHEILTIAPAS